MTFDSNQEKTNIEFFRGEWNNHYTFADTYLDLGLVCKKTSLRPIHTIEVPQKVCSICGECWKRGGERESKF